MSHYRSFVEHLDPNVGPKRILALDGGGLRGVLTLGMLSEIESRLRARHGGDPSFRLCDYFDLIAGTSTGSIIAAALSTGMSVDEVHGHYMKLGNKVFKDSLLRWGPLRAVRAKFDADDVAKALKGVFGERTLAGPGFRTGLLVMTKRLDTGSPWPVTNNPNAKYHLGGSKKNTIPNAEYPLWQVVRASTAAPTFFDPEYIQIAADDAARGMAGQRGDFVDGGVSPSNNPALQAVMTATMDGYRLRWPVGADRLLVVSVGTGKANPAVGHANVLTGTPLVHAVMSLSALMEDCADQVETVMQWLSRSPTARVIDREMGQAQPPLGGTPMFSYLRYNVLLMSDWVRDNLGETLNDDQLKALEAMDEPKNIPELHRVGRLAGRKLVKAEHFESCFDSPRT
jgi:predicted acylesterase/phospholipase RssA